MGDKLYVVIPAYNEEENIEKVISDWYPIVQRYGKDSKLLVVDDGSKDSTYQRLKELAADRPALIVHTKKNGGHGETVLYAYKFAVEHGADYIFQTDSDGQTSSDEFELFWNMRMQYDIILGDRQERGDGKTRALIERVVCVLLLLYWGIRVPDANAPFRLMKAKVLKKYLYKLPDRYDLPNIILTAWFVYYKESVCFKEITFKSRQGGENSVNIPKIIKVGWKALYDFGRFRIRG